MTACGNSGKRTSPYVIARTTNWQDIALGGTEKTLQGFSDDLLFEISRLEDIHIEFRNVQESNAFHLLENDPSIDAILSAMDPNEITRQRYSFSEPYFTIGPVLIVRADSPYSSLADMKNKEIGFPRYSPWISDIPDLQNLLLVPIDQVNAAFDKLWNREIDGLLLDSIEAYKMTQGLYSNAAKIITDPLKRVSIRLVTLKGKNQDLLDSFNKGLENMRKHGLYSKMLKYWGLYEPKSLIPPLAPTKSKKP